MKDIIISIVLCLLPSIAIYLGISFTVWEINPQFWSVEQRSFLGIFGVMVGFVISGGYMFIRKLP